MKHKIRNENNGFTLIELVITIAVLAVISVPLLMYFTDSMRHSARMKEQQNAVIAAQNVLEDLKVLDMSLDNVDYLTLSVTPPPGASPFPTTLVTWEQIPPVPAADPNTYEVKGQYSVNKQSYMIKAKITSRSQSKDLSGATKKVYHKAKAPRMDSAKDMIITEKATAMEDAKLFFYHEYTKYCDDNGQPRDPSITIDSLENCLKRKIIIKAEPDKDDAGAETGKVALVASYEYKWRDSVTHIPGITDATTYSTNIKGAVLSGTGMHNIFLFYTPLHDASTVVNDEVVLGGNLIKISDASHKVLLGDPGTGSDDLQYRLYLVADGMVDRTLNPTYKTELDEVSGDNFCNYISEVYTNLKKSPSVEFSAGFAINSLFPAASQSDSGFHCETLLESPEVNRMAEIEVSVYKDKGDGSIDEATIYTTVNGTKVQSQ